MRELLGAPGERAIVIEMLEQNVAWLQVKIVSGHLENETQAFVIGPLMRLGAFVK